MLTSHQLTIGTRAEPRAVWAVLTSGCTPFLHGLRMTSDWCSGSTVVVGDASSPMITGTVLHADPPTRLSFTLDDGSGETTYLTWLIERCGPWSVLRLHIDDAAGATSAETEDAWLPVLEEVASALGRRLPEDAD